MIPLAPRLKRTALFLIAPAVCLALFWRAPFIWFLNDDFGWLGIRLEVHSVSDLLRVLFVPRGPGHIRVLSDRLYFLVLGSAFDMNALPFRICAMATWFASLTLATLIGARLVPFRGDRKPSPEAGSTESAVTTHTEVVDANSSSRLTRSGVAGVLAAVLWTANAAIVLPLVWASAYDQVLCALCILLAFYARLRWLESGRRGWMITEWTAYLLGFGALELIVMYPFVAALHALCRAPKRWLSTVPLFVPAAAFGAIHYFLIPRTSSPYYSVTIDARLPATLLQYVKLAIAPVLIAAPVGPWRLLGLNSAPLIAAALLAFAAWRARHRDFTPLFYLGWFVLLLAPVLPLPEHVTGYYLTIPVLGFAWLAGWAIVSAWPATGVRGALARTAAVALVAVFLVGSIHGIASKTRWDDERSNRLRLVVQAVDDVERKYPGTAVLLSGVDGELFDSGLQDDPFRLHGLRNVYLAPGEEGRISARLDLGGLAHFLVTPQKALNLLDSRKARVLVVSTDQVLDKTGSYTALLRNSARPRGNFVDVGDPDYAAQLGPTWFGPENGTRWMPETATVKLFGIDSSAQKLYVTGYAPEAVSVSGPVTLIFRGNGREIGSAVTQNGDDRFSLAFPLPAALIGQSSVEISIHVSKTLRFPGDRRDLGVIFGTFSIR
jgi:hypothetical protein